MLIFFYTLHKKSLSFLYYSLDFCYNSNIQSHSKHSILQVHLKLCMWHINFVNGVNDNFNGMIYCS